MNYFDSSLGTNIEEHTGFPNPGTDDTILSLDLQQLLIKHPSSTFFMRVGHTDQWQEIGVFANDILIIDRSLQPRQQDIVVWWREDSFVISYCSKLPRNYQPWGVVTNTVHQLRRN